MKKILTLAIPALLSLVPAMGTDNMGVINDPDFTAVGNITSIRMVVPDGNNIVAIVDATDPSGRVRTTARPALVENLGWDMDDNVLSGREKKMARVVCGPHLLEKEYISTQQVPYEFQGNFDLKVLTGKILEDADPIPLGEPVTVHKVKKYLRPDETIYQKIGKARYRLLKEEIKVAGASISICQKEWKLFSQWEFKTRHEVQHYSVQDIFHVTNKISLQNDTKQETVRQLVRTEGRKALFEAEVPTCGTMGQSYPANFSIIE